MLFLENKLKNRYLYKQVHSIIVHCIQKMKATQWCTASVVEWINKMWSILFHTCSGIIFHISTGISLSPKKEGNSDTKCKWMNLKDIMLRFEISWSQKDKYCMILLKWGNQSSQIHKKRK